MQIIAWQKHYMFRSLVAFSLLASSFALAESITVYGDQNHAPLGYLEDKIPKGILVEMFNKISKITGDTYKIELYPWGRAQMLAIEKHGALMNVSKNSQRIEVFDFSDPMYFDDVLIVVRKGEQFTFTNLHDLKGKTLGGNVGASYGEEIAVLIRAKLFIIEHDTNPTMRLKKLLAGGRMDAALIPGGNLGFEAALSGDAELIKNHDAFAILKNPFVHDPIYLAVEKSLHKNALISRFNAALKIVKGS